MSRSDEKRQQKGSKQRSANSGGKGSGAAEAKPTEESKKTLLEYQPWYHGLCLRSDCEELLRKEGDFLVRATDDKGQYNIVISVAGKTRVHHFKLIQSEKGKWKLDAEGFDTTYDLVKNYWRSGRPLVGGKDLFLKRPIKRPKWMVSWFNIEEGKRIGEGAYGEVLLGILKDPDTHSETKVAIKRCKEVRYANEEDRRAFLTEAKLMLELKHENVLSLLGIGADRPPVRLIMEFCPGGSLDKYLKKRKETITLSRQAGLCLESARGMKYLADKQIVHRDLAARNCLLGLRDEVKIADFGMSVKAKQPGKGPGKIAVRWAAPEAMLHAEWTTKSDVYSFGILMWEIYSFADLPWGEKMDNFMVKDAVLEGRVLPQPKAAPNPFYQVMKRCCALDKTQRPDFQHIITELSGFSYVSSVTHGTADDTQVGRTLDRFD